MHWAPPWFTRVSMAIAHGLARAARCGLCRAVACRCRDSRLLGVNGFGGSGRTIWASKDFVLGRMAGSWLDVFVQARVSAAHGKGLDGDGAAALPFIAGGAKLRQCGCLRVLKVAESMGFTIRWCCVPGDVLSCCGICVGRESFMPAWRLGSGGRALARYCDKDTKMLAY